MKMSPRQVTTVRFKCPHCNGTGKIELTGIYRETFDLLCSQRSEISGADLAKQFGCKTTAMNNRLVALEKHGLAVSRKYGRERLFLVRLPVKGLASGGG